MVRLQEIPLFKEIGRAIVQQSRRESGKIVAVSQLHGAGEDRVGSIGISGFEQEFTFETGRKDLLLDVAAGPRNG